MSSDTKGKRVGLPTYIDTKHPKSGPRKLQAGDMDKFESGYEGIVWSNKKKKEKEKEKEKKVGPPSCPLCNETESNPTCPIC